MAVGTRLKSITFLSSLALQKSPGRGETTQHTHNFFELHSPEQFMAVGTQPNKHTFSEAPSAKQIWLLGRNPTCIT